MNALRRAHANERRGHGRTLPHGALRNIHQSSMLSRFDHDAWSRDLCVGIPAMHFTLPMKRTAFRLNDSDGARLCACGTTPPAELLRVKRLPINLKKPFES
jgi:hypothetical protein